VNPHFVQAFVPFLNAFTNHQEAYICPARFKVVIDNLHRMRKNLYLCRIPTFVVEPHFIRLIIRMELFWTFAIILKDPFGTLFGGGPHPRQDSVVGVLSRLIVGLNEPHVFLRILENSNLVEPIPTDMWRVSPRLR
jgi:hypothetical protein